MKALRNKILVKIDTKQKERYSLTKDITLHIEKGFDFNKRQDMPSRGEVIDGENLPTGADILIHHNATDKTYEVEAENILTEEEKRSGYKVLSIPKDMGFCFKENGEWVPCEDFLITQRIFKEYKGLLSGIPNEQVKNRMYVVRGMDKWDGEEVDLSGKCVVSLVNCDYQIIWMNKQNKEETLIRTRHREIIGIDYGLTKDVENGKYLVGISQSDAKPLKQNAQAS